ncbi:MAG: prophage antirepressor [uncultured bacterium]|nr:MAG: prophage antirepressor [uncultured bacterium]
MENTQISLFKGRKVRKIFYKKEWWFVINDVIEIITGSADPAQYFKRMKYRSSELFRISTKGGKQFAPPVMLGIVTSGGKQKMYCWNTAGILRLIQSIPSSKAEPFRIWLANVGYERMQEIEDPELATKRTRLLYKGKGYSDDWIREKNAGHCYPRRTN